MAGKSKFHDDVINYEGAQLRAVYLVTAESAQPLHPDEPPEPAEGEQTKACDFRILEQNSA